MTDIAQIEREKYEYMWKQDGYRVNSPGLNIIPTVMDLFDAPKGSKFTDYGAGEGKVIDYIKSLGFECDGFDLVKLHPDVKEACLWELPFSYHSEYATCFDVMEHIPEQFVRDVLERIHLRTRSMCAFTVATIPCAQGRRHNLTLHETVQPLEWWEDMFRSVFMNHEVIATDREWRWLIIAY